MLANLVGIAIGTGDGHATYIPLGHTSLDACPNLAEAGLREVIGPDEIRLTRSVNHRRNFLDAVRTRSTPISHIDAAVRSDAVCHLADISMRLGRKLRWNPEAERFEGDETANRMRSRTLRSPWRI